MGFFDELFGLDSTREKMEESQKIRNAEMKRRKEVKDEENQTRLDWLGNELSDIRRQAEARKKKGWF